MFQKSDGIEELIISLEKTTDSSQQVIWEYHQQKFEFWENGRVNIPQTEEYKVVITARRGDQNEGYVALDDFYFEKTSAESCNIYPLDAAPTSSTTSTSTSSKAPAFPDCDFETDYCDWSVDEQLNGTELFVFIRTSGNLHQDGDGPQHDHTEDEEGEDLTDYAHEDDDIPSLSLLPLDQCGVRQGRGRGHDIQQGHHC